MATRLLSKLSIKNSEVLLEADSTPELVSTEELIIELTLGVFEQPERKATAVAKKLQILICYNS